MRGDPAGPAAFARGLIELHAPEARTLLELGCGTGAVLELLPFDLTGVDLSEEMLRVARAKRPGARFVHGDMTTLALGETFDVVLCIADAINHLRPFAQWERVFARSRE